MIFFCFVDYCTSCYASSRDRAFGPKFSKYSDQFVNFLCPDFNLQLQVHTRLIAGSSGHAFKKKDCAYNITWNLTKLSGNKHQYCTEVPQRFHWIPTYSIGIVNLYVDALFMYKLIVGSSRHILIFFLLFFTKKKSLYL